MSTLLAIVAFGFLALPIIVLLAYAVVAIGGLIA